MTTRAPVNPNLLGWRCKDERFIWMTAFSRCLSDVQGGVEVMGYATILGNSNITAPSC